ncbi:MAG: hypothetical protein D4R64_00230 [Porphyromonadaceae bacterium]|nr:MAG: hypothetical protein D4R64_00230 [Porphyromonadaceae bacterium]
MGSDPSAIKWSQTNVHQFHLIYPKNQIRLAGKYSEILNDIGAPVTASMQSDIRSIPVIMHPFTSYSNGSSILAPRRIELFPKQPIALETNDFASQLIIHEVRHFAQMDRLNTGITRVAGFILGEQAQSIVLGLHVPKWLLEGDAVLTETLLSHAGRGRLASFIQPLRSRLVDNKDLSWDRVWFGSYHELLPDEYVFGYFLTARARMLADPLIWSDALGQIGRNPFNIKGLSGLTRPKTGFRFSKLYVETLDWLRDFWTNPSLAVKTPDSLFNITRDSHEFLNYYRPQQFSNHEVICLKKTMGDLPAFVIIDSSANERIIARPGTIEDAGFSYHQGKLVWSELIQDPRWENRSWSELFVYDFKTGRKTRLTYGQRYFSPVFSPSGDRIAAIDEQVDGSSYLRIIDPLDGRIVRSMPEARNDHFSYLCWGKGPDELYAITTGSEGRKLIHIDFREMVQEILLDAGYTDIACPAAYGDWIYFSGPAGATQGLYRINSNTHITEIVFGHPHGINYLSTQDQNLFLSVYSANGYRPAKVAFGSLRGKTVYRIDPLIEPVTAIIQRAYGEFPVVYSDTIQTVAIKQYSKIGHLFKLHSWSPLFLNPDSYQISPGVVLMSQNDLSTLTCWAGYQYNKTDLSHNLLSSLRYTGLYPTLEMDYSRKYRNPDPESDSTGHRSGKFPGAYWQFLRFGSGIPLNFSSGAWSRKIQPTLFFEQVSYLLDRNSELNNSAWMAGLSFSSVFLRKTSYRDLFPKWGVSMNFSYFKAFSLVRRGNNMTGRIILYLPGLLPNSSLRILNSATFLTFDQYFNSIQDFPRGQVVYQARDRYNLKIDYAFPIAYPDYHLSWLIYIKRIKTDLFFDAGTQLYIKNWFISTGLDLTFDYHLVRSGIQLESGIRMMYFPTARKIGAEFLFAFSVN